MRLTACRVALACVVSLSGAASAQPVPALPRPEPVRIVLPVIEPGCATVRSEGDVIVVCGREDRRYRIDPVVLAAVRARDARNNPSRREGRMSLFQESCNPVGPHGCDARFVLPVSSIALTVATALIRLAKSEDVRPMLRHGPSDYDLFQAERAKAESRVRPAPPSK